MHGAPEVRGQMDGTSPMSRYKGDIAPGYHLHSHHYHRYVKRTTYLNLYKIFFYGLTTSLRTTGMAGGEDKLKAMLSDNNVEHHETSSAHNDKVHPVGESEIDFLAENLEYGPRGVRGLFTSGRYILSAAVLASLGGFSFGYDQGVMGVTNVLPQFHAVIPRAETAFGKGLMTGMLLLGAFVGCWFYPYISDRWSRKTALLISSIIFTIGAVIQTAAYDYPTLVVGRAIGGVGTGTLALGAPIVSRAFHTCSYVSDINQK